MDVFLNILLMFVSLFLMMIILLQRGRGGGLAGAFGGAGGQSAFGTKAGDVFTWITVVTATVWVLLAGISGCYMRMSADAIARRFESEKKTNNATGNDGEANKTPNIETKDLTPPAGNSALPPLNNAPGTGPAMNPPPTGENTNSGGPVIPPPSNDNTQPVVPPPSGDAPASNVPANNAPANPPVVPPMAEQAPAGNPAPAENNAPAPGNP